MATRHRKLLELAARHHGKISFVGYIIGIIWFLALAHPSVNNRTYFSENALLAGMVDTQYEYGRTAKSLKSEVENPSEMYSKNFTSWLMEKMIMIGLESYQQNFVVDFPQELSLLNEPISGTNVYGILRAPRMARTEALVLLTPLKSESSGPFYELVFLLSLAEHFRNNVYWAKDIIFLVVDQKEIGIQSWLDEYHGIKSKYVKSSRMLGRSGAIQAAINLELDGADVSSMQILVESLNGQLPNLDMVNMVAKLCNSEGIPVELNKLAVRHFNDGWDEYRSSLSTMVSMMFSQASGRPSANHGLFPKYGIEAVTLRGRTKRDGRSVSFRRIGRALEGMFRSLNSLLERFHQSFFFYLLSSTFRYISIGLYMPPLGCVMIGPIFTAISCWISSVDDKECREKDKGNGDESKKDQKQNEAKEKIPESSENTEESSKETKQEEFAFTRIPRHFGKVLRVILAGHFVGFLFYISPYVLRYIEVSLDLSPSFVMLLVLFDVILLVSSLPFSLRQARSLTERDLLLLNSISLVIYVCQVGCLATINFSFGFFLAIFTVPVYLFVRATQSRLRRVVQVILVFIFSPLFIILAMSIVHDFLTVETDHYNIMKILNTYRLGDFFSTLRDSFLLGTWTYPVTVFVIFPNWLLFWSIAWM